jgi:hypothetical protein
VTSYSTEQRALAMGKSRSRRRKKAMGEMQSPPSSCRREQDAAANQLEVTEALGLILGEDTRSLAALRDIASETGRGWNDVVLERLVMKWARTHSPEGIFGANSLPSDLNLEEKRTITSSIHRLAIVFERINRRHQDFDFDAALRFVAFCVDQVRGKIAEGGEAAVLQALEAAEIPGGAPPDCAMHGAAA